MTTKEIYKRGCPELEESEKRSLIAQFRCTQDGGRMHAAADKSGQMLSDWLRDQAVRAAKRAA